MQTVKRCSFIKFVLTYGIKNCPKETARIFVRSIIERTINIICIALSEENKIIGYTAIRKLPNKYDFDKDVKCDKYIIGPIFVREEYRSRGVGKSLLKNAILNAAGDRYASIYAYVGTRNYLSQNLFTKYGFLNIGYMHKKKKYYISQGKSGFFVFRLQFHKEK